MLAETLKPLYYLDRAAMLVSLLQKKTKVKAESFRKALDLCFLHHRKWVFTKLAEEKMLFLFQDFTAKEWKQIFKVTYLLDNAAIAEVLLKHLPNVKLTLLSIN